MYQVPSNITTRETFPKAEKSQADVEWEGKLRITGGALNSSIEEDGPNWVLVSEWDLIRQGDT
jgi:hypothetical protein